MIWSLVLTATSLIGLWFAGTRPRLGWGLSIVNQATWIAYAIDTRQYGFILLALCYGAVYVRNWRVAA